MDGTLHLRMWVPFFVVCSGTTHQIISEVMLMAVRKEYRDLTVDDIYKMVKAFQCSESAVYGWRNLVSRPVIL